MVTDLEARIYFTHHYSSWGNSLNLNEYASDLVRQHFPKDRDLTTVTDGEVEHAMDNLNNYPRKSLGYRAPFEVFFNTRTSIAVALQSQIREYMEPQKGAVVMRDTMQ